MDKEKYNWKSLFINEDENSKNENTAKEVKKTSSEKFPNSNTSFPKTNIDSGSIDAVLLDKILKMYESGFDSLNKSGYDFYEFFKAIQAVNSNDPSVYKMAFSMAQGVDSKVNKSTLLNEAEFYITEIKKVHRKYKVQGLDKKSNMLSIEKTKKTNLSNEISSLEKQLLQLQTDISKKKNELDSIDGTLLTKTSEIDKKIAANDIAKNTILESIQKVATGIKNNI